MNEKEIIKGKVDKLLFIYSGSLLLIGIILTICVLCDGGISAWFDYAFGGFGIETFFSWGGLLFIALGICNYIFNKNCEICITNKRIYGTAIFGNRIDIPVDSISSIGVIGWLKGVVVSSSSGSIRFLFISNSNEIHQEISRIIMNRSADGNKNNLSSNADELKKYKDLLDCGAITQEEYETKKKELLK